ncbi:hypothetical protein [Streptosporangium sp. NPDC049078]|uniref:hypothetical protein n=1 Tax=Streptosporangium sp. NPDC049078 TaxID=3155767 RepID=UPI003446DA6E
MDSEWNAAIRALARFDADAARARLHLAAGGTEEEAAEIMRGEAAEAGRPQR